LTKKKCKYKDFEKEQKSLQISFCGNKKLSIFVKNENSVFGHFFPKFPVMENIIKIEKQNLFWERGYKSIFQKNFFFLLKKL